MIYGMRKRIALLGSVICVAALLPGSAQAATPSPLVKITLEGGYIQHVYLNARAPKLIVYPDGRVLLSREINPYVFGMREARVTRSTASALARKLSTALVTPKGGWGEIMVSDMSSTRIVLNIPGRKASSVDVFDPSIPVRNPSTALKKARANLATALAAFVKSAKGTAQYKPTQYEAWTDEMSIAGDGVMLANPAALLCFNEGGTDSPAVEGESGTYCVLPSGERVEQWEHYRAMLEVLPQFPGETSSSPCTVVKSSDVTKEFAKIGDDGRWMMANGSLVRVLMRPVLPGEKACARF